MAFTEEIIPYYVSENCNLRRESVNFKVSPSYLSFYRLVSCRCASAITFQGSSGVVYVLPDSRMLQADPHVVHKILFCIQTLFRSNQALK